MGVGASSKERIQELLHKLGIDENVLSESAKAELSSLKPLGPKVVSGNGESRQVVESKILDQLRNRVRSLKFESPVLGNIRVADYLSYVLPVVRYVGKMAVSGSASPSLPPLAASTVENLISEQTIQKVLLAL